MIDNRNMMFQNIEDEEARREKLANVELQRLAYRRAYQTPEGLEVLTRMLKDSGVFSIIDPKDEAAIGGRNFVISILESMGCLDEDNIRHIAKFLIENTAVMPVEIEEEKQ